jgi:ankyrin repeat protein
MGASCSSNNQVVANSTKPKNLKIQTDFKKKEDQLKDKDAAMFASHDRPHERLWKAIENNDKAAADKYLTANDIQEQSMYDPAGQTMLHRAASLGHSEMLMLLIERTGVKPDVLNAQLATPLHIACKCN